MNVRLLPCVTLALLLPAAALGAGVGGHTIFQSPRLWSTIDICNTKAHPQVVGVRGSIPGSGVKQEQMFMRFRLQYQISAGAWRYVGAAADSGYAGVGAANFAARQSGRNFLLAVQNKGKSVTLRGVVSFQWRRGGKLVRRAQKASTAGHRSAAGADPRGFSSATCTLTI